MVGRPVSGGDVFLLRDQLIAEGGQLRVFRVGAVGEMIVVAPIRVGHDLARLLEWDRHEEVLPLAADLGQVVREHGIIERRRVAGEVILEG